jgi:2-dehydropantoate 2-reductase
LQSSAPAPSAAYVGVKLALAGEDVTFIVRGANLEAIARTASS